jgi:DNA uptake protein ComE-like DNA-binding protein
MNKILIRRGGHMLNRNRRFKSLVSSVCIVIILISSLNTISARGIVIEHDKPKVGIVIDVIDGEAVKVMYLTSTASKPEIEQIRLIGVDSMASDTTYEYTKNQLLGKSVFVLFDDNDTTKTSDFTNAYVYLNTDESFNETLLKYGYGKLDKDFINASYYTDLVKATNIAIRQEKGIYKISTTTSNSININLASSGSLMEHLDITWNEAARITTYRRENAINSSEELGFITSSFDRSFIEQKRSGIHYITSINDATVYELTSLFDSSNALIKANDINISRIFKPFKHLEELKDINTIERDYDKIKEFLTITLNDNIYLEPYKKRANINTASLTELNEVSGLSFASSRQIVKFRSRYEYPFYSIQELNEINFPLQYMDIKFLTDDFVFETNMNTANEYELKTLFSLFNLSDTLKDRVVTELVNSRPFYNYSDLKAAIGIAFYEDLYPYIYLDDVPKSFRAPINVNAAKPLDIANYLNLTGDVRSKVLNRSYDYSSPDAIDFQTDATKPLITLNTNINHASYEELMNLNSKITPGLAKAMIEYRSYYPFYSLNELKEFLDDNQKLYVYDLIKDYVVFY